MKALPVLLVVLAAALLLAAAGALKNVVIAHPDGPRWAFGLLAVILAGLALFLLGVARRAWRALR